MANDFYVSGREGMLGGGGNLDWSWSADTIKVQLIDETTDAVVLATDDYYNDIAAGARPTNGTSAAIANKTTTDGVADTTDATITFTTVSHGEDVDSFTLYKDSGAENTSPLICNFDTVSSGLPLTPNTGNITITWDTGANGIFNVATTA